MDSSERIGQIQINGLSSWFSWIFNTNSASFGPRLSLLTKSKLFHFFPLLRHFLDILRMFCRWQSEIAWNSRKTIHSTLTRHTHIHTSAQPILADCLFRQHLHARYNVERSAALYKMSLLPTHKLHGTF